MKRKWCRRCESSHRVDDRGVLDELPKAYKDIDRVMDEQEDLVEIVATLKQVICVKG